MDYCYLSRCTFCPCTKVRESDDGMLHDRELTNLRATSVVVIAFNDISYPKVKTHAIVEVGDVAVSNVEQSKSVDEISEAFSIGSWPATTTTRNRRK